MEEATAGTGLAKRKAGREANGLRLSMAIEISGRQAPTGHYIIGTARVAIAWPLRLRCNMGRRCVSVVIANGNAVAP